MTQGFALNHDKSLRIYFCVKRQAKKQLSERCQKHNSLVALYKALFIPKTYMLVEY